MPIQHSACIKMATLHQGLTYIPTLSLFVSKAHATHTHKAEPLHHKSATGLQEVHSVALLKQAAMM